MKSSVRVDVAQHTFVGRVATPEMALEVGDACCWSRLTRLPCLQDSSREFPLSPWSALGLCPVMLSRTKDQGPGNQQGSINDVGDDQTNRVCVRVLAAASGVTAVQSNLGAVWGSWLPIVPTVPKLVQVSAVCCLESLPLTCVKLELCL